MKILATLCALAISASAQVVGPSGIVTADGNNIQFTHEQAGNTVLVGPSGIVTKDGNNIQLNVDFQPVKQAAPAVTPQASVTAESKGLVGPSGIVHPDGNTQFTHDQVAANDFNTPAPTSQIQFKQGDQIILLDGFTQEQVDNFASVGPSGIVTKDGQNIQLRSRRSTDITRIVGPSGIVDVNGNIQFTHEQAEKFNHDGVLPQAETPKLTISEDSIVGASGIVSPNGNTQFTLEEAQKFNKDSSVISLIVPTPAPVASTVHAASDRLVGPSGIVDPSGNIQFSQDQANTKKESTNAVPIPTQGSQIKFQQGDQIILLDGFTQEQVDNFASIGPSGIVTKDGQNIQLRERRSAELTRLVGPSGIVDVNGNTQFTHEQAEKFNKDGSLPQADTPTLTIQEESIVGASGIVSPHGNTQFTLEQAQEFNKESSTPAKIAPTSAPVPVVSVKSETQIRFTQGDQVILLDGFTQEQVDNFAYVGPSGIVTKDGQNIQLRNRRSAELSRLVGPSGIVDINGNTQFTHEQAEKFKRDGTLPQPSPLKIKITEDSLVGASGIVSPSGNTQFTIEQAQKYNKEGVIPQTNTPKLTISEDSIVGASGIVSPNGNTQFTLEEAQKFNKESLNTQETVTVVVQSVPVLNAPSPTAATIDSERLVGPSGIVDPSGNIQFTQEQVDSKQANGNIASSVTASSSLLPPILSSLVESSVAPKQEKNFIANGSSIEFMQGDNLIILNGFTQEQVDNFAYIGPSGIVTKDGQNLQLV